MKVETTRAAMGNYHYLKCECEIGFHSDKWREGGFDPDDYAEIENMFLALFGQFNQDKCSSLKLRNLCRDVIQTVACWHKAYMEEEDDAGSGEGN